MNKFSLIICTALLAGCVSLSQETGPTAATGAGSFPQSVKAISQMHLVKIGMLKPEVKSLLDEKLTIGYQEATPGAYTAVTLNNPYRFETLKKEHKVFDVYYYFTGIKQTDGKITDDELMPVVFENEQLVGKGWSFFDRLRSKASQTSN